MNQNSHKHIEQPLGRILSQTGKSFLGLINEKLSHLDIDRNFYALLLIEQGYGEITQQDLADRLNSDKATVVRVVDYLSEKGYVIRKKDSRDKRKYSLCITEKAKRDLPAIKKALKEVKEIAFKVLNPSAKKEFLKSLAIIKNNLNK